MKISICSDLHLEFATISLENKDGADVLILSGDIMVANDLRQRDPYEVMGNGKSAQFHRFFQECSARFPHVIYVFGNHEHYHGDFAKSFKQVRDNLAYLNNLYILDKELKVIDDVTFIGGTLWTDMNKEDALTLYHIKSMMNDFRIVHNSNSSPVHYKTPIYAVKEDGSYDYEKVVSYEFHTRIGKFTPEDAVEDHRKMLEYIDVVTSMLGKNDNKYVVVGHHAPSKSSTKPRYQDDTLMNGGYSSDLSDFILDRPCIKLWTHGHTHDVFDYMVGSTRVVCNPRGYDGYEDRADRFELLTIEV